MIELTVDVNAEDGMLLMAPLGMSTPEVAALSTEVSGADWRLVADPLTGQFAIVADPRDDAVRLTYRFQKGGAAYPELMFEARDSRFSRSATALVDEARAVAIDGGPTGQQAIVQHVKSLFTYGHPTERFYDGSEEIPQICDITAGSCVDINAYLIAMLRAAGYEAGYMTGYFVPEEKRTHCTDSHCWVVTRSDDGALQYWDIAHHLKMGLDHVTPALNPKPGVRVPMSHSFGWFLPDVGIEDLKLLAEPMWFRSDGAWKESQKQIRLVGYDVLAD